MPRLMISHLNPPALITRFLLVDKKQERSLHKTKKMLKHRTSKYDGCYCTQTKTIFPIKVTGINQYID